MTLSFPFEVETLSVTQPLGTFFVAVLPAELLLLIAESDVMSARYNDGFGYKLTGTQRVQQEKRLTQIAAFIDRVDSAFPNSIILAANYNEDIGVDLDEAIDIEQTTEERFDGIDGQDLEWTVRRNENGQLILRIPSPTKLAAIIDGQHRLAAFKKAQDPERLDMDLLCAIYLDLPKPFQAQLFATINSTQKPVDRSLTYELFGYNVSEEPEELWTPDKLAVFLTRKLGTEADSPMRGKIMVAPKMDQALFNLTANAEWRVSTAVVVDGILRLISSNPRRDANLMRTVLGKRVSLLSGAKDKSPLRNVFVDGNDYLIYTMVKNYTIACQTVFWGVAQPGSYILKTVGVQALFDILRKLAPISILDEDLRVDYFIGKLQPAGQVDFADGEFKVPAGSGRSKIRQTLEGLMGI